MNRKTHTTKLETHRIQCENKTTVVSRDGMNKVFCVKLLCNCHVHASFNPIKTLQQLAVQKRLNILFSPLFFFLFFFFFFSFLRQSIVCQSSSGLFLLPLLSVFCASIGHLVCSCRRHFMWERRSVFVSVSRGFF